MDELIDAGKGMKAGIDAALEEADAQACAEDLNGQQLTLLPLHNAGQGAGVAGKKDYAGRGPGRPPGAKNKRTEAWKEYLLSRYASPLEALAATYSRPLDELCADLLRMAGAAEDTRPTWDRLIEVLKIQLGAAKELAPYLHSKQPQAIQNDGKELISLVINTQYQGAVTAADAENFDLEILDLESVENQGLSNEGNQKSNGEKFNEKPESGANSGLNVNQVTD